MAFPPTFAFRAYEFKMEITDNPTDWKKLQQRCRTDKFEQKTLVPLLRMMAMRAQDTYSSQYPLLLGDNWRQVETEKLGHATCCECGCKLVGPVSLVKEHIDARNQQIPHRMGWRPRHGGVYFLWDTTTHALIMHGPDDHPSFNLVSFESLRARPEEDAGRVADPEPQSSDEDEDESAGGMDLESGEEPEPEPAAAPQPEPVDSFKVLTDSIMKSLGDGNGIGFVPGPARIEVTPRLIDDFPALFRFAKIMVNVAAANEEIKRLRASAVSDEFIQFLEELETIVI